MKRNKIFKCVLLITSLFYITDFQKTMDINENTLSSVIAKSIYDAFDLTTSSDRQVEQPKEDSKYVVVIDPGHGGNDVGALSPDNTYSEKEMTLAISKQLGTKIEELDSNIEVVFTRQDDSVSWKSSSYEGLKTRVEIADNSNADLFVSLHMNSYQDNTISGFETWTDPSRSEALCVSTQISENLNSLNYTENRGQKSTRQAPLQVIDTNPSPSVLVEMGFITSDADLNFFSGEEGKEKIADALASAIIDHKNELL